MMEEQETDWERWNAITPPTSWVNDWNESYSEIYDWYPWMRKFYSRLEIEKDCITVRERGGGVRARLLRTEQVERAACFAWRFRHVLRRVLPLFVHAHSVLPSELVEWRSAVGADKCERSAVASLGLASKTHKTQKLCLAPAV